MLAVYLSSETSQRRVGCASLTTLGGRPGLFSATSSEASWKSLRGAAQRAQPTGGRSPSVEPLDSCLCPPARRVASIPCVRFRFCVCGGFVLQCAPRPACLGAAPRRPSCCLTSSFSYSMGWCCGGRLCSSSGGNRRKSESQVGIHPVFPSPPSDVCVLGSPYARCLSF